jgi:hypothetical protein
MRFFLSLIIVLIIAAIVGYLGYKFFLEVWALYNQADSNVKLGMLTATGSAVAFITSNAINSSRERKARLFESKRDAYNEFFDFFFSLFKNVKNGTDYPEDEMVEKVSKFTRGVMTWGSAKTVNAVIEWQKQSENLDGKNIKSIFLVTENLLRALREDLGHSDSTLKDFALTKLILKADEHHKLD